MTVREPIALLQEFPSDRRLFVRGHEGGCHGIAAPADVWLIPNMVADEWYGPHFAGEQDGKPAVLLPALRNFRTERTP